MHTRTSRTRVTREVMDSRREARPMAPGVDWGPYGQSGTGEFGLVTSKAGVRRRLRL